MVREKLRRSVLEPKSNPHGIQADFPQIMRWYQPRQFGPKAPSNFELQRTEHGCISSRVKQRNLLLALYVKDTHRECMWRKENKFL